MRNSPKVRTSAATKARRVAHMLATTLRDSQKSGGYITLDEAFRELDKRDRSEASQSNKPARHPRTGRRS